jgi:hypothetical protein
VLLQIGTVLIGILGGLVYRVASSRRAMADPVAQTLTSPLLD